jgi:hypothetical protein
MLASLTRIRDVGDYSSRNTSKGALLTNAFTLFSAMRADGVRADALRDIALRGQLFPRASYENRQRIWDNLHYRYFAPAVPWVSEGLANASVSGASSPDFRSMTYLYFALRDRLTFDLVTKLIWQRWRAQSMIVSVADVLEFIANEAANHPTVKLWRPSTRTKLAQSILAALRDFGLLRGVQAKEIQRPPVSAEAVFHLLCILVAEGRHGRAVIEAPDWRLFLWSEDDAAKALAELEQRRWIRFERGGRTVILELIRIPEIGT